MSSHRSVRDNKGAARVSLRAQNLWTLLAIAALLGFTTPAAWSQEQPLYQITGVQPTSVPANSNGASFTINVTQGNYDGTPPTPQACFYTGSGSAAPFSAGATPPTGQVTLAVPASTIQAIPGSSFTAANGYMVTGLLYFIPAGSTCDGTFDSTLTNQFPVAITAPTLATYTGPTNIPQTNSATNVQAAPTTLLLTGSGFTAGDSVQFGSLSTVVATVLSPTALTVKVPAAFSSSTPGATAAISVCYGTGDTATCFAPSTPITLTVVQQNSSTGLITATPSPAGTADNITLSATFRQADGASGLGPGAPSGAVTFTAGNAAVPAANLVLDTSASFSTQTTLLTTPTAATPSILPPPGSYTNQVLVRITDATAGAAIYYTTDGSTPTAASTLYSGPFQLTTSATVQAIAAIAGSLNSAVASAAYTVTSAPPAQVAFVVQPGNTATSTAISPAVQVAVQDANGNTLPNSTLPVTVALGANPGEASLQGTLTVNAVGGIATFTNLSIASIANGYTLVASSGSLATATSTAFNITPYPITMKLQSKLVGINSTLNGTFILSQAAPAGGVTVTLSSSAPANVTVSPASVTVAAGQTTGAFTYTGVAAGDATLSASAPNYLTGTAVATGTAAQVSLGTIPPVAPGQSVSLALSLPQAAPPGGTTVTFTSSNTSVATVTSSIFVPAGQRTAATNPQINGIVIGNTTIVASAPGFAPDSRAVNVTVVASISPNTTYLNLITSTNTKLTIAAPAPSGGISFTVTTDDPTVATVASPVTIAAGATSAPLSITGVKDGSTTLRADSPGVTEATGTLNIISQIDPGNFSPTTGNQLQRGFNVYLPINPSVPTTVTLTVADPTVGLLSTSTGTVGSRVITVPNITGSYVGYFYFQGQRVGTTTIAVSAPGFTTGNGTATVDPSGFIADPYYYSQNFSVQNFSGNRGLNAFTAYFDPTSGNLIDYNLLLNPGIATVTIPITSSNTSVGTVTTPFTFAAGSQNAQVTFTPVGAGTAQLTLGAPPAPFITPANNQAFTATVTTPVIDNRSQTTGVNLQNNVYVYLPVAPPSQETVTITNNNPAIVAISTDPTVAGTSSVVTLPSQGSGVGYIYLQGLAVGTATLTVSAPNYTSATYTITVQPSGFSLCGNGYECAYYKDINQLTTNGTQTRYVHSVLLNTDNSVNGDLALSPGVAPVTVTLASSDNTVATVSPASFTFQPGSGDMPFTFTPGGAGTAQLTLSTPTGYTQSTNGNVINVTLTAPALSISFGNDVTTGAKLLRTVGVYLQNTPQSPVTVTITSANPSIATISSDSNTVGTGSITLTSNTSGTYVGTVYVQGQTVGSTQLTATASGYASGTNNVTVTPSGFTTFYDGNINTTTFSSPTNITISASPLDPNTLNVSDYPQNLNPGLGTISVPVISSAPSIGTISTSPVTFTGVTSQAVTTFQPVAVGVSNITLGTPAGFSTPNNYNGFSATVTPPGIYVNDVETGLHLQTPTSFSLAETPPNPVTVTITSNGPQIALISKDGTVTGSQTVTFTNVTTRNIGSVFIQGESLGNTTFTVSAPGYNNANANVTVDPSGFALFDGSFSTNVGSNRNVNIYPTSLTPGTLTRVNYNSFTVTPDAGTLTVSVANGNNAVGTLSPASFTFMPGVQTYGYVVFQPVAGGTDTLTLQTPAAFSTPSQAQQVTVTVNQGNP